MKVLGASTIGLSIAILQIFLLSQTSIAAQLAATPSQLVLSNTVIDLGQYSFTNAIISGGSGGPYSGQWSWFNANQMNNEVVNTVNIGQNPNYLAFNPSGTLAYVTNSGSNNVSVISVSTNTVVNSINVGNGPNGIAINPSGTLAYVVNGGDGTVSVIELATNTVINTITVGSSPIAAAFNPSGTLVYVTNAGSNNVKVINVASNSVVNTINVGHFPWGIAFNPSGSLVYVTNFNSASVSSISTASNSVVNTIAVGLDPDWVAFNPQGTLAYVADYGSGDVSVINTTTNSIESINLGGGTSPEGIAINPSGTLAYVANSGSNNVSAINLTSELVINSVNVGSTPSAVAFNANGMSLYVVNSGSNNVSVVGMLPETSLQNLPAVPTSNGLLTITVTATNANTLSFDFNGITYTQSTGSNTIYGQWNLYGFAQDNGIKVYYYGSNTVLLSNTLTVNPTLDAGRPLLGLSYQAPTTLTSSVSGGTPPYSYQWYSGASTTCSSDTQIPDATSSTYTANIVSGAYYCYKATDSATTQVSMYSSTQLVLPSPPQPTISNTVMDVGQTSYINAVITGGSGGPYSGQWSWIGANFMNNQVAGSINIGTNPNYVAFNPSGTLAYVAQNTGPGSVSVINAITNTLVNTIDVGYSPTALAFNPSGTLAYVPNSCGGSSGCSSGTISVVSVATNTVVNTIDVGLGPEYVAFNPSGTFAYDAEYSNNTAGIIDTESNTIVDTYQTGILGPEWLAVNPSGNLAYITNSNNATMAIINPVSNTTVNVIPVGRNPDGVAFNPSGTLAYVATAYGSNAIYVVNTSDGEVVNIINVGPLPAQIIFNPSGTLAYVTDTAYEIGSAANEISVIDTATNSVIYTIPIYDQDPQSIAINPAGTMAYVTTCGTDSSCNSPGAIETIDDLPETAVQALPSDNSISISINPTSSNTIEFNYGGTAYYENTGANTIYGQFSIYGFAQDNGTNIYYYGSNTVLYSNSIAINPSPSPSLTLSSSSVTPGQVVTFNVVVSGGVGPFNVIIFNVTGGSRQGTSIIIGSPGGSNTLSLTAGAAGTFSYNAIVTDTGTTMPFVSNSGAVTLVVSGGGSGGGGAPAGVCSGNSCSTGAGPQPTTVATTSIPATTTVAQNQTSTRSSFNVTVSKGSSQTVYYNQSSASFSVASIGAGSASAGITISNATSTSQAAPTNYTKISALNITISNPNVSVNATLKYPCSIPSSSVKPFILENGTWTPISPYTINAASCSISFAIPPDPVVALMSYSPAPPATTLQTTTVTTTVAATTAAQTSIGSGGTNLWEIGIGAAIVIIAISAYLLTHRRKTPRLGS